MAVAGSGLCPANAFLFNSTFCVCDPGRLPTPPANRCDLFIPSSEQWAASAGVGNRPLRFPINIISFDSIDNLANPQAVFLEATAIGVFLWLVFCFFVRWGRPDDGRSVWFTLRWWISRLDVLFHSQHWLEDQKVVKKRKTELGGTFSIGSWILFIGLLAALLYHVIAQRKIEVHNVKAVTAADLVNFVNDLEFNITTISSMSCSQLKGLDNLVIGTPGSIYHRVSPLSNLAQSACHNTSDGPTISIKCDGCRVPRDRFSISWQFVDLPTMPAMAVGFQFNLTAKAHGDDRHVIFISGVLKNASETDETPVTFRGPNASILEFHLFPQLYHNFHNLRLIQPLFHQFVSGTYATTSSQLQSSLQSSQNGLVNSTLFVQFLSDYLVEIDNESIMGPVAFLADAGGLFSLSCLIFLYALWLFERGIKRLRNEDSTMRAIRGRKRAIERWDKLRKFVMYTYGINNLDGNGNHVSNKFTSGIGPFHRRKPYFRQDSIGLDKIMDSPTSTGSLPNTARSSKVNSKLVNGNATSDRTTSKGNEEEKAQSIQSVADFPPNQEKTKSIQSVADGNTYSRKLIPGRGSSLLPPLPEIDFESGADISLLQKNLKSLYEYNIRLNERLASTEHLLEDLIKKTSSDKASSKTLSDITSSSNG